MYCPNCSEKISKDGAKFCAKCGFLTKDVASFLGTGGEIENLRQKGIKQGVKLILVSVILLPILIFLIPMFPPNDTLVESSPSNTWFEQIGWAIIWTTFLAGVARIAYTLTFKQIFFSNKNKAEESKEIKESKTDQALPPIQDVPISNFGKWKTTEELFEPIFVKQKPSDELK